MAMLPAGSVHTVLTSFRGSYRNVLHMLRTSLGDIIMFHVQFADIIPGDSLFGVCSHSFERHFVPRNCFS